MCKAAKFHVSSLVSLHEWSESASAILPCVSCVASLWVSTSCSRLRASQSNSCVCTCQPNIPFTSFPMCDNTDLVAIIVHIGNHLFGNKSLSTYLSVFVHVLSWIPPDPTPLLKLSFVCFHHPPTPPSPPMTRNICQKHAATSIGIFPFPIFFKTNLMEWETYLKTWSLKSGPCYLVSWKQCFAGIHTMLIGDTFSLCLDWIKTVFVSSQK